MNNKKLKQGLFLLIFLFAVAGITAFFLCYKEKDAVSVNDFIHQDTEIKDSLDIKDDDSREKETTLSKLAVHIVGCVVKPGVYYMNDGDIVNDVVNAAGGLTKKADVSVTNLAARITDGMMIVIYSGEQVKKGEVKNNLKNNSQVNINTASKEELMTLAGIGEAKAEAIISYRKKNGNFKETSDIMNIPGIKEAVFNKIKDSITI